MRPGSARAAGDLIKHPAHPRPSRAAEGATATWNHIHGKGKAVAFEPAYAQVAAPSIASGADAGMAMGL